MEGWIKIDRSLRKHWIWNDDKKLKWWLTILMEVNFEDKKVLIGNRVYDCKRGESIMSLRTWAKLFNTTPKTVKTFFLLLSNDSIIETQSIGISTHLKVCNYDTYQESVNAKYTPLTTQSKQELPTTKERKESKEYKKEEPEKIPAGFNVNFIDSIINEFLTVFPEYIIITLGKEKAMAGKLLSVWKKNNPGLNTEETLKSLRVHFEHCKNISDDWYRTNMSLSLMVTKYNQISKLLKNGSNKSKDSRSSKRVNDLWN